jgi:hypothetical protein
MKNVLQLLSEWYWRIFLKLSSKPPVFVFQMGKVGSSTVYFSLKKHLKRQFIVHSHDFSPRHRRHTKVRALYKHFTVNPNAKLKIITLVRDPIGRNLSGFFQEYEDYVGRPFKHGELNHEELKQIFLEQYNHRAPLDWMDRLMTHFGIDVYAEPILPKHFKHYKAGNSECLLMRHDLDNRIKEKLIQEYLAIPSLQVENFNESIRHLYGAAYRDFKQRLVLPKSYLDMMLQSKYYKHFYSAEEIRIHLSKWSE